MLMQEVVTSFNNSDAQGLLNVSFKLMDYIGQNWNYLVVVSGVIVGWRFSAKDQWTIKHKIIATVLYSLFAIVNSVALHSAYSVLSIVFQDLKSAAQHLNNQTPELKQYLLNLELGRGGIPAAMVIYLLAFLFVLYCVWFLKYKPGSK